MNEYSNNSESNDNADSDKNSESNEAPSLVMAINSINTLVIEPPNFIFSF